MEYYDYKETITEIESDKIEDIIYSRLISKDSFEQYKEASSKGRNLSKQEEYEIQKFSWYMKFEIPFDLDENIVLN